MNNLDYISQLNMEELPIPDIKYDTGSDINSFADLSFFDFDSTFNLKGNTLLNGQFNLNEFVDPQQQQQQLQQESPVSQESLVLASTSSSPSESSITASTPSISEVDKKKRNTAASARFRIKKKLREQEMERNLKQLTEKINGYNLKIQQLEMENQCLKSLIIEKNEKKSNDLLKSIKLKSTITNNESF